MAVALVVYKPRLNVPLPVTREVTSTVVQTPVPKAFEEPIELPIAGALL